MPQIRAELPRTDELSEEDVLDLLHSEWHEERLLALLVLGRRFSRAKKDATAQQRIVSLYLVKTRWINNWDLVDGSAPHLLGAWLLQRDRTVLGTLAASTSLWEQRIAILATQAFIRAGVFADTLRLSASHTRSTESTQPPRFRPASIRFTAERSSPEASASSACVMCRFSRSTAMASPRNGVTFT